MNILDYKTLMIIYSAGTGGNHVSNILSTSKNISPRFQTSDYRAALYRKYTNTNQTLKSIHTGITLAVSEEQVDEICEIVNNSKLPYILQGHLNDAYNYFEDYRELGRICIIVLEWDKNTSITHRNPTIGEFNLFLNPTEIKFLYHKENLCKLFSMNPDDVIPVMVDDIVTEDASSVWKTLSNQLDLDLDLDFCNSLHTIWYNKFFKKSET
jgi:hypothetical protein